MSALKKILFGGATAGLALSFMLPASSDLASNSAHAATGPRFSKPWMNKNSASSQKKVRTYAMPKSSDSPASSGQTSVAEELDKLYKQNSQSPPANPLAFDTSERSKPASAPAPTPSPAPVKQSRPSFLARLFGGLKGGFNSNDGDYSDPSKRPAFSPQNAARLHIDLDNSNYVQKAPYGEDETPAPTPSNVAAAPLKKVEFPDLAQTPVEKPKQETKSEAPLMSNGFIPPLPDEMGSEPAKTQVAVAKPQNAAKQSTPAVEQKLDFLLPPLPDAVAVNEKPATPAEPEVATNEPEANSELMVPEPVAVAETETFSEPIIESPTLENGRPAGEVSQPEEPGRIVVAELNPIQQDLVNDSAAPKPLKGELKANVPLAPSVSRTERPSAEPGRVIVVDSGWKPRHLKPVPQAPVQEPNTFNVPDSARPAPATPSSPVQTPTTSRSPEEKYQLIAARGEATGFKGFCPVVLRNTLELVDASPIYQAEYEGQIYYFSSMEAKAQFEQDPLRFVPANNGLDLIQLVDDGVEVPGRLDYAVWYQDRLFLFATKSGMESFRASPQKYLSGN
ncbi:MAG: hypothetical protein KDA78_13980 [Planctomycetaceae bacterium]|nr:hypothetical protein [Planctomycetaceae bacterium]